MNATTRLYRILTTRYPGRCGKCRGWFAAGARVAVIGGGGTREYLHPGCAVALHPGWAWPERWLAAAKIVLAAAVGRG